MSVAPPVHTSGGGLAAQRSRLSQQVHLRNSPAARGRRGTASVGPEADEDAEGEDDIEEDVGEESGDAEDKSLYCVCQKMSYGEVRTDLNYIVCARTLGLWALFYHVCTRRGRVMRFLSSYLIGYRLNPRYPPSFLTSIFRSHSGTPFLSRGVSCLVHWSLMDSASRPPFCICFSACSSISMRKR